MDESNKIVIENVTESYAGRFLQFLDEQFFTRETLWRTSGRSALPPDLRWHLSSEKRLSIFQDQLKEGFSLAAIDQVNGNIVGVALNVLCKQSHHQDKQDYSNLPWKQQVIYSTLDSLGDDYNIFKATGTTIGLELRLLGVHEDYGGKGLATLLAKQTIRLAQEHKLGFVESSPSSPLTSHIFQKLGFKQIKRVLLSEVIFTGKPGFPYAKQEDSLGFVVLKL